MTITVRKWFAEHGTDEIVKADDGRFMFLEKLPASQNSYYIRISDRHEISGPIVSGSLEIEIAISVFASAIGRDLTSLLAKWEVAKANLPLVNPDVEA